MIHTQMAIYGMLMFQIEKGELHYQYLQQPHKDDNYNSEEIFDDCN